MPVYNLNSKVLAVRSDDQVLSIAAVTDPTLSQTLTFLFTGDQKFAARDGLGRLATHFPGGENVWIDSIRITIPGLNGIVNSNSTVIDNSGSYALIYPEDINGSFSNNQFIVLQPSALNDWIPINVMRGATLNYFLKCQSLEIDVDFRNVDTAVFDGISIYAYLELKINSITNPIYTV